MTAAQRPARRALTLILFAAIAVAACGVRGAPPTPTPAPVTVRFAFQANVANYMPLADSFHQKHPNITIELVSERSVALTQLKMQNIDAFRDTVPYLPGAEFKSEMLPLDEYITAYKAFPTSDWLPGLMDTIKVANMQVGVPAGVNPVVAYYDARRFANANVRPPVATWTLDDFVNAAAATNNQIAAGARDPSYVVGFCSHPLSADPVVITYLMGGQLVDSLQNPTRPTLDSAANVRAVQWYTALRTVQRITPDLRQAGDLGRYGAYQLVAGGDCGVWLGFYADMGGRSWGTVWLGEAVMMPLPRAQGSFNAASVDGYFIMRRSAHPQEAWLWLTYLLEHESAAGTQIPPRRSQIDSQAYATRVSPDVLAVARSLPTSAMIVGIGSPQNLAPVVNLYIKAVEQVVLGDKEAAAALAVAQASALPLFGR